MKILAISDTHGKLNKVRDIWPKLTDIDMILHAGDFIADAEKLQAELGVPVIGVKGNCDGGYSSSDFRVIPVECGNILLTHGHMENVSYQLNGLMYKAMENDCSAVVFGHTHKAMTDESNGIRFINPGRETAATVRTPSSGRLQTVLTLPSCIIQPSWEIKNRHSQVF